MQLEVRSYCKSIRTLPISRNNLVANKLSLAAHKAEIKQPAAEEQLPHRLSLALYHQNNGHQANKLQLVSPPATTLVCTMNSQLPDSGLAMLASTLEEPNSSVDLLASFRFVFAELLHGCAALTFVRHASVMGGSRLQPQH
jgi:hypothetical protein